jgi:EAL domain-containing protein (putative c-di-GMP-specific phosphodiesterase class I)
LARWVLPTGDRVAPSIFIPLAERTGIIHALGAWVLRSACGSAQAWARLDAHDQVTTLSVNVSSLQINDQFLAVIEDCLRQTGFPAAQLELEITESALLGDLDLAIEHLRHWKALGVQIALDDFGTGYSSLVYLARLPIDRLKLDQSLVRRMTTDKKCLIIIRSILALAEELDISVLAEGIETEHQLAMITDLGCPRAQGYLLGRPMPAEQAHVVLRRSWGNRPAAAFRPVEYVMGECLVH